MKKLFYSTRYIIPFITAVQLSVCVVNPASADDDFGRFFTTPMQRQYLDQLKSRGTPIVVEIEKDLAVLENETGEAEEISDTVTVKGLVYRKGGRNAAWLNNSNTFEGDIASGYTDVAESEISSSGIKVRIGNKEDIRLKVGQKYEPATENIRDIVQKSDARISVSRP